MISQGWMVFLVCFVTVTISITILITVSMVTSVRLETAKHHENKLDQRLRDRNAPFEP